MTLRQRRSRQPFGARESLNIGREATRGRIAGWDIDIRPDGQGLPVGKGTVKAGEPLYVERCAALPRRIRRERGRWPILSGGNGSRSRAHDPIKIGRLLLALCLDR